MGCQRDIAKAIVKKEADYLLAVKGNQGRLEQAFIKHFSMDKLSQWMGDSYRTDEQSHGRFESSLYMASDIFDEFVNHSFDWVGMKTLGVVLSGRIIDDELPGSDEISLRYYISSAELTAEELAEATRSHWYIENKLHWRLDVVMREDNCRIRERGCC